MLIAIVKIYPGFTSDRRATKLRVKNWLFAAKGCIKNITIGVDAISTMGYAYALM
ncbi:hypothetical protein [Nostoc sp. DedQUE09]|uniref:hypothetical protein n=1 Tax=Nostoc sp. DedQUE09 TaxID=3075394 RepID=UPI002AD4BC2F|nr:hypothetical protein [Nostoc sp. DedQUE09]MDZ7952820.1 hypothetical protein [Nostoc sp. DedQUE09]